MESKEPPPSPRSTSRSLREREEPPQLEGGRWPPSRRCSLKQGAIAAATTAAWAQEPPLWGSGRGEEGHHGGDHAAGAPRSMPLSLSWGGR